jgi:hypothetical protein
MGRLKAFRSSTKIKKTPLRGFFLYHTSALANSGLKQRSYLKAVSLDKVPYRNK